ncbi:MAG TPA: hypothetical protein VFA33_04905 [Bryobacteraceae bacterium]|nr:hypothetical protein [Bryobacteraceae bacterium]
MLKLRIRADLKCKKHPHFDPAKEGRGAIKGGCIACETLCDLHLQSEKLLLAAQYFQNDNPMATAWRVIARRELKKA